VRAMIEKAMKKQEKLKFLKLIAKEEKDRSQITKKESLPNTE